MQNELIRLKAIRNPRRLMSFCTIFMLGSCRSKFPSADSPDRNNYVVRRYKGSIPETCRHNYEKDQPVPDST